MKLKEPKLIKTTLDTIKVGSRAGFFGFAPRAELPGEPQGPLLVVSAKFAVPQAKFLAMAAKPKGDERFKTVKVGPMYCWGTVERSTTGQLVFAFRERGGVTPQNLKLAVFAFFNENALTGLKSDTLVAFRPMTEADEAALTEQEAGDEAAENAPIAVGQGEEPVESGAPEPGALDLVTARLRELITTLKGAAVPGGSSAAGILKEAALAASQAAAFVRAGDAEQARGLVDNAMHLVQRALADAERDAGAAPGGQGAFDEAAFRASWAGAKSGWERAMDTVNAQVTTLQSALKNSSDADLHEIADSGLSRLTGNHRVRLMAAMSAVDQAIGAGLGKAAPVAAKIAAAFLDFIEGDEKIALCEELAADPSGDFHVTLTLVDTLSPALAQLVKTLEAATP